MGDTDANPRGRSLQHIEYRALLPLYERALEQDPDDPFTLDWLGHAFTSLGRYEDGLRVDLRLASLRPADPTVLYNLACSYSLLGRIDESLDTLDRALHRGYSDLERMLADEDLAAVRGDPRFQAILDRLREE